MPQDPLNDDLKSVSQQQIDPKDPEVDEPQPVIPGPINISLNVDATCHCPNVTEVSFNHTFYTTRNIGGLLFFRSPHSFR